MNVPIFRDARVFSWPKSQKAAAHPTMSLGDALHAHHATDAHFATYSSSRRLSKSAFDPETSPDGVRMVAAVFDVDAHADGVDLDAWWIEEQSKIDALLVDHPGAFVYRTRAGYRIVYAVDVLVRDAVDVATWSARYVAWVAYLRRRFAIVADHSCKDVTRLFRLPFVRRDGRDERRETIGDARALGTWAPNVVADDHEVARKLARQAPPKVVREDAKTVAPLGTGEGLLVTALRGRGDLGREIEPGKWAVRCPWESEHSGGTTFDSSTIVFAPALGESLGWPHCSHAHCSHRGLRDWLATFADAELEIAREKAGLPKPAPVAPVLTDERPSIVISTDEARVNDEAVEAIGRLTDIYQRGAELVDIVDRDGRPCIRVLGVPAVRELLSRAASFVTLELDKQIGDLVERPVHVPTWCVTAVHARENWGLPTLRGVIDAPALRPDGTILQVAGFDASTGYYYAPTCPFPPIPEEPNRDAAIAAADEIAEVFVDFPFADEASRAGVFAWLLTFFARPAFDGPSPLMAVSGNVRGSGKGRLTDAVTTIALGVPAAKMPMPKEGEELRKRILTVLRDGERACILDNVVGPIESPAFDMLLTSDVFSDRLLGVSEKVTFPNLTIWAANGNNLEFGADTARRTLLIRLESPHENPEDRGDFVHPDLIHWTRANRPRLAVAALTILRAYVVAGKPRLDTKLWGSFEAWSSLVAGACVWAGLTDPQKTRAAVESVDNSKAGLVGLLAAWRTLQDRAGASALTVRKAIEMLYPRPGYDDGLDAARDAVETFAPVVAGRAPDAAALGRAIRSFRGRVVGGSHFEGAQNKTGVTLWRVA